MSKQSVTKGATSQIHYVWIRDSSSTVGAGLTGLAFKKEAGDGLVSAPDFAARRAAAYYGTICASCHETISGPPSQASPESTSSYSWITPDSSSMRRGTTNSSG